MKSILVTGSDGFIGQHLVKKLESLKWNVICVDKQPHFTRTIKLDVSSPEFFMYFCRKNIECYYIFHLGSPCSIIQFNHNPQHCRNDTILGFSHALYLAHLWSADFIYPSSGNVYGCLALPHKETVKAAPTNLYGQCKLLCENLANNSDVNTVGLRIYAGYGPGEEQKGPVASVLCLFLQNMMQGNPPIIWGDGTQTRDFIYINDVINALIQSMTLKHSSIINVGSGTSYSYNDVINIMNTILGTDITPQYVEKPENYVNNAHADISLMKNQLGLNPTSLTDGLTQFITYLEAKE